ncbi:hypothetical protein Tcan_12802 [Toxocara canis]|uniref:Uncharacterized protein n=1 Tax=Toxocara canis TaxID=6265 RepID=A0A0B2UU59_TOXCA|nr:hypothetical protein Tcan_12802 [Toxocara canis]
MWILGLPVLRTIPIHPSRRLRMTHPPQASLEFPSVRVKNASKTSNAMHKSRIVNLKGRVENPWNLVHRMQGCRPITGSLTLFRASQKKQTENKCCEREAHDKKASS